MRNGANSSEAVSKTLAAGNSWSGEDMGDHKTRITLADIKEAADLFDIGMEHIAQTLGTAQYDHVSKRTLTLTFEFRPLNIDATKCAIISSLHVGIPQRLGRLESNVMILEDGVVCLENVKKMETTHER